MPGVTNRGKMRFIQHYFGNINTPAVFYVHLITPATAPTAGVNTLGQLTQMTGGNGYTSFGQTATRNTTDFDTFTEQDNNTLALTQLKNIAWTATGGTIPSAGSGARYAVLCLDNTSTVNLRDVLVYWDLTSERTVSNGQTITLQNLQINAQED